MSKERIAIKTIFGEHIYFPDQKIYVKLPDGKFTPIPAREAYRYAGNTQTIFRKDKLVVDFSELEKMLMSATEGEYAQYRKAKLRLHDELNGGYTSKFGSILRSAAPEEYRKEFLDELYGVVKRFAQNNGFETVARPQLDGWYRGDEIAPRDWRHFAAIASAKNNFPTIEKLQHFYDDFQNIRCNQNVRRNDVDDNLYYAYIFYKVARIFLGKRAMFSGTKKNGNGNGNGIHNEGKVNLDALKNYFEATFNASIDENYCAAPLLGARCVKQDAHSLNKITNNDSNNSIFIANSKKNDISLPIKTTQEVVHDVAFLERILLNIAYDYSYGVCDKVFGGEAPKPTDSYDDIGLAMIAGSKHFTVRKLMSYLLEQRIRKANLKTGHLDIAQEERNEITKTANDVFKQLFESQMANEALGLEQNSLQRLKKTYDLITPVFPKIIEELVILEFNLKHMSVMPRPIDGKRKRKFDEELYSMRARLGEIKDEGQKTAQQYKILAILSEHIPQYVYRSKYGLLETSLNFQHFSKNFKNGTFEGHYFKEKEFTETLKSYDLEEFIDKAHDVQLLRKL